MRTKLSWQELEQFAGIKRNRPPAPTQNDVARLTRKRLGSAWGKTNRKRRFG